MDNWTGEVYAENGIYVHEMEDHREEQEPVPPYLRHGEGGQEKGVDASQEETRRSTSMARRCATALPRLNQLIEGKHEQGACTAV